MKQALKLYLESDDIKKLTEKANECGYSGRGCLSYYISKVANEQIIFLDKSVIKYLNKKR